MPAHDLDEMRRRLRAALFHAETDATTVSQAIGRGKDYVRDFLSGRKASLSAAALADLETALRLPPLFLSGAVVPDADSAEALRAVPTSQIASSSGLKVFAAVETISGDLQMALEPVDVVPRPWFLMHVQDSYGLVIAGDSLSPIYETGDMVFVNPRLPLLKGKHAIFTASGRTTLSTFVIRFYSGATTGHWLTQHITPLAKRRAEEKLSRRRWTAAARIVGKYTGA